jgi:hypothetical protein
MSKRKMLRGVLGALLLAVLLSVGPAGAVGMLPADSEEPPSFQVTATGPIPDLASLLDYPFPVHLEDLSGEEKDKVVDKLMQRPEVSELGSALSEKGFVLDPTGAEAMRVTMCKRVYLPLVLKNYADAGVRLLVGEGKGGASPVIGMWAPGPCIIEMMVVPTSSATPELSAYLVAMVADDGTAFFQAHHTNLDPMLAEVPDPPIEVNGMPYFYVTTLHWIGPSDLGLIVPWHYWWYDSHHHPNWYYACYQQYWGYYASAGVPWPWWHHWVYGWYYWRFWYYWSTWFPWTAP